MGGVCNCVCVKVNNVSTYKPAKLKMRIINLSYDSLELFLVELRGVTLYS